VLEGLGGVLLADDTASPFCDDELAATPSVRASAAGGPAWKIVIVDDEQEVHDVTSLALRNVSFRERTLAFLNAHSASEARVLLEKHPDAAVVLLDVVMETEDAGLALVRYIRESLGNPRIRVVLRTGCPGQAPEATVIRDYDISDYRTKTELTSTRLFTTVIAALRSYEQLHELERLYEEQKRAYEEISRLKGALERERDYLREEVKEAVGGSAVLGTSPAFASVLGRIDAVARTDATVLLLGESGVGKEVLARAIHERSPRASGPLVKVNCAGIPRELFESEFFGHIKGSFTGAIRNRVGRFELAHGGTIFLDEIGEIPIELQSKLLRALQEHEFECVGDTKTRKVDVRVIAATNRDLKVAIAENRFRADLYYRISVFPVEVPPLRQRREDIILLFEHFLARACRASGRAFMALTPAQAQALESYAWPGNVRELENVVERAVILSPDGVLRLDAALPELGEEALGPPSRSVVAAEPLATDPDGAVIRKTSRGFFTSDELRELERENILAALDKADWRIAGEGGAADLLGIKPSTLSYQMRSFGIERSSRPPAAKR
jgi:transcriptional regulator with GAF, ATPase, and Fis domain/CheY-like chemotaxis protein